MDGIEQFFKYLKHHGTLVGEHTEKICRNFFKENNCDIFQVAEVENLKYKAQPRFTLELDPRNKCTENNLSEKIDEEFIAESVECFEEKYEELKSKNLMLENRLNLYVYNFALQRESIRKLIKEKEDLITEKENLEHKNFKLMADLRLAKGNENFRFSSTMTEQILENKKLSAEIEKLGHEKDRLWENAEAIRMEAAEQEKEHELYVDHFVWCLNMWSKLNYVGEEKSSFGSDICRLIYDPNPDDGFYRFNLKKVGK